eukprot:2810427-Alexandrium_andersonii.AAC.1
MEDGVIGQGPQQGACGAPMPTLRRRRRTGPAQEPEAAWTHRPATVAMRARRSHSGTPSPSRTS